MEYYLLATVSDNAVMLTHEITCLGAFGTFEKAETKMKALIESGTILSAVIISGHYISFNKKESYRAHL
jgi:hypothetical protein